MTHTSILFPERREHAIPENSFLSDSVLKDLNLELVISDLCAQKSTYNIRSFFFLANPDLETITFRQSVFQDLDTGSLKQEIEKACQTLMSMHFSQKNYADFYYEYQKQWWFLDSVRYYCQAVSCLMETLVKNSLSSSGLNRFRDFLQAYTSSTFFTELQKQAKELTIQLTQLTYSMTIKDDHITVYPFAGDADYTQIISDLFAKFSLDPVNDFRTSFNELPQMNHVEAGIINLVAKQHPQIFNALSSFSQKNHNFIDEHIAEFELEIQFYLAYLDYIAPLKNISLPFCYPQFNVTKNRINAYHCFDLALAKKLAGENKEVVTNDFYLENNERVIVVSGPNQGGKTTFARMVGQIHYLAALGLPVAGNQACLFLFDHIYTHFEREENVATLHSRLQDELLRIYDIISEMTPRSIVILNEIFTSTTTHDALFLSQQILDKITDADSLCIWVTFIDELASFSEKAINMLSIVDAHDPTKRTFHLERKRPDGKAYAFTIAEKYQLTYEDLQIRITS